MLSPGTYRLDSEGILTPIESPPAVNLSDFTTWLEKVDVFGQIRVRHGSDFERIQAPTRNRQRIRIRIGADLQATSELKFGARMTTGDRKAAIDPRDRKGAPLSYQDLGDVFDKVEVNFDRIYIEIAPEWLTGARLELGKFRLPIRLNPIFSSPVGDLVWDEAANAEGAAAIYERQVNPDRLNWRVTAGISPVFEVSRGTDASLFYGQLWTRKPLIWDLGLEGALAYYHWNNLNPDGNTTLSAENNFGNQVVSVGPNPEDVIFASKFHILNPMLILTRGGADHLDRSPPWQIVWETFINRGSFDPGREFGYTLGAMIGPGIHRSSKKDWLLYYSWVELGQESVFTPVAQDDFQEATNFRGQMFGLAIFLWDRAELRFSFLSDKPILPVLGVRESQWRGRADLTVTW